MTIYLSTPFKFLDSRPSPPWRPVVHTSIVWRWRSQHIIAVLRNPRMIRNNSLFVILSYKGVTNDIYWAGPRRPVVNKCEICTWKMPIRNSDKLLAFFHYYSNSLWGLKDDELLPTHFHLCKPVGLDELLTPEKLDHSTNLFRPSAPWVDERVGNQTPMHFFPPPPSPPHFGALKLIEHKLCN